MALATLGCSKKTEDTPTPTPAPTRTQLLTNKNWIESAATVNPGINYNGTVITDLHAQRDACLLDNFVRFETPNTYKADQGAIKCNPSDPQTTTGTWVFNGDETILTVTPQGGTASSAESINVTELTDTSLKFTETTTSGGINHTYTYSYRKG